jgi:hypothetical protein
MVTMSSSLGIILQPTHDGWAVCLTDGRRLVGFRGPGARWRAERYLARYFSSVARARTQRFLPIGPER